ncbi:hypothetical protein FS749_014698 [Ceratobasidium sp. UAMH 11750]|nr:hypothetical protein FS749_014698 [Ceratobasidium sp. UAMH 11750]
MQRLQRKASKGGRKANGEIGETSRINWAHPLIWPQIEAAARAVGYPWSPVEIVRRLQQQNPTTFATLRPQRISQWRDHSVTNELRWTLQHLRSIEEGKRPQQSLNHLGVLAPYPDIVSDIVAHLQNLRDSGVPLTIARIRGYMVGVIKHQAPHLFDHSPNGTPGFTCSVSFVHKFLHTVIGWSP